MPSQDTQEAIQQATRKITQETTWRPAQLKETEVILTFGQLSFSISHQEAYSLSTKTPSTPLMGMQEQTGSLLSQNPSIINATGKTLNDTPPHPPNTLNNQEKKFRHHGKQSMPVNRIRTAPRFVKIPQATKDWQKVSRKPKRNKKEHIECFYCHKKGHIQRFCWQKINCFNCGKRGHKFSNCNLKTPPVSTVLHRTGPKHPNREQQQPCKPHTNLNMEPEYVRPPLGDIFAPPRQALNEHNSYLSNVGLIILIRGSPTHDLPRLIAENLADTHGGHPNDFVVTQATISPFIVTCRNVHLRDAIVQRGIYTIPQARVQYTIHEWRARFGMGYDPTTHQVWVKIVGLPLQAWTTEEITAILRRFGHPMQILPYGQEAGHFLDITALVATKSPNRIPLAYTYREGEYATKIEIIILSWRLWDESYFPPPGRNNCPHCPYFQPRDQAGPSNPQHQSPSSSASGTAPSEPTIDLSAWSPRSRQIVSYAPPDCNLQISHSRQSSNGNKKRGVQQKWIERRSPRLLWSSRQRETPTHERSHTLATPDPDLLKTPTQLFSFFYAYLTAVPNPIAINPLRSLWTTNSTTIFLGEARKRSMTICTVHSLSRCTIQAKKSSGKILNVSHTAADFTFPRKEISFVRELKGNIPQPNSPLTFGLSHPLSSAQDKSLLPSPNYCQAHPDTNDIGSDLSFAGHVTYQKPPLSLSPNNEPLEHSSPKSQIQAVPLPVPTTDTSTPPKPQGNRQKAIPIRRSQRILQKRSTLCPEQKSAKKSKSQVCKISFLDDSHQTPLDISKTIEILQATGLTINEKIEEIIDEAVKQDQPMENTDQTRPTTPLHDMIPPLAVPGTDLLL